MKTQYSVSSLTDYVRLFDPSLDSETRRANWRSLLRARPELLAPARMNDQVAPLPAEDQVDEHEAVIERSPSEIADAILARMTPELVDDNPEGFTVVLSADAARSLRRETARAAEGMEWGGALLGIRASRTARRLRIEAVEGAGPYASRSADSITFDVEREHEAVREFISRCPAGADAGLVGRWHTHPDRTGRARPSEIDLLSWALALERGSGSAHVALIVQPEGGPGASWLRTTTEAFVAYRDRAGEIVIARAELYSETH